MLPSDRRKWQPIGVVTLNPERDSVVNAAVLGLKKKMRRPQSKLVRHGKYFCLQSGTQGIAWNGSFSLSTRRAGTR